MKRKYYEGISTRESKSLEFQPFKSHPQKETTLTEQTLLKRTARTTGRKTSKAQISIYFSK